ncbi:putative alkaline protease 1 [Halenospora varia]|nr:putative alkaline protease 1 [Halenospora varia]
MHLSTSTLVLAILPLIKGSPLPEPDNSIPGVNVINPTEGDVVTNQYIVVYNPSVSDAQVQTHQDDSRRKLDSTPGLNGQQLKGIKQNIKIGEFKAVTVEATPAGIEKIAGDNNLIDFVELDTLCTTGDPIGDNITQITLPSPQDNRGLAVQVNPTNFWNLGRISHKLKGILTPYVYNSTACFGTRVYVVDTGIWLTHAEFGGRAIWGANFIMGSPDTDENGHGTHCAGIMAGASTGVCKQATVVAVKVLSATGSGSTSGVISGVQWAVDNAQGLGEVSKSVISMSLGGGISAAMDAAVTAAFNAGVFVAVAAGNDGLDAKNNSPARAPIVMTVGATDINDFRPSWSNTGSLVDIHAPGVSIFSSWIGVPTGDNWYNTISGTSMATPHVAGMAAYYIAKEGLNTPAEVTSRLLESAVKDLIQNPTGTMYSPNNLLLNNGNEL